MPPEPSTRFDLTAELRRERRLDLRSTVPWAIVLLFLGLFLLLGAAVAGGGVGGRAILGLFGVLLAGLSVALLVAEFVGPLTAIAVTEAGLEVSRAHRAPLVLAWNNPRLGIRVTEFLGDPRAYFQPSEPRYAQPQWIFIASPVRQESTVPIELVRLMVERATQYRVPIEQHPSLVFTVAVPRDPSVTVTSRRIAPGDSTPPNGRVTLIGPAAREPGDSAL